MCLIFLDFVFLIIFYLKKIKNNNIFLYNFYLFNLFYFTLQYLCHIKGFIFVCQISHLFKQIVRQY